MERARVPGLGSVGRRRGGIFELAALAVLVPLAGLIAAQPEARLERIALVIGLAVATLARNRESLFQSECALKLLWVMGGALAFSCAGLELLILATGTSEPTEQWAVLEMGLDPRFLWSTALPLSLLIGLVLLGGAPFHFWAADLFQGTRPWLAPLIVAALQVSGGIWVAQRLSGIESFPPAARAIGYQLEVAAFVALLAGAVTLAIQRRPERRVGTLASLNGALVLAAIAATHSRAGVAHGPWAIGPWAGHLTLALAGAGVLACFAQTSTGASAAGPVLFRRHPWTGIAGLFALASLAGVPGTPGARLWLELARSLASAGKTWTLLALGAAWLSAFGAAVRQAHEGFGATGSAPPPERSVPWQARAAIWIPALGLLALYAMR